MKKKVYLVFMLALLLGMLFSLTGCGKQENVESEDTDIIENQDENIDIQDDVDDEDSDKIETSQSGSFVKYKEYTYYWKLHEESREDIGISADYYDNVDAENELIRADEKGKEKTILKDKGNGEIFIVNDKIFLSYAVDEYNSTRKIYSVDLDGKNKTEYTEGIMKYIVGNDIYCETKNYGDIFFINAKTEEIETVKKNAHMVGLVDDVIYYTEVYDYKDGNLKIGSITDEDDNGTIATFSSTEFSMYSSEPLEIPTLWGEDDKINFYVGYRAGTALILQELYKVEMDKDGKNLEKNIITDEETIWNEAELPKEGVYLKSIQEGVNTYSNVIIYVDEETKEPIQFISEGEICEEFDFIKNDESYVSLYKASIVGDDIYVVVDFTEHYPENDIGWRYAYKREKTVCFKYNIETKEISKVYEF